MEKNEHQNPPAASGPHAPAQHGQKPSPIAGFFHQVRKHPLFFDAIFIFAVMLALGGIWYWQDMEGKIFIEKAEINAPIISLSPTMPGQIDKFYVEEGDEVSTGQKLAQVGGETITAKTGGVVVWINNMPGQIAGPGNPVVKMIDPRTLRVLGRIQENKGLKDIKTGQKVVFSVDAYPDKRFEGFVDSIGTIARQSDIVFSISDKRESREFEVRALFDTRQYSELKEGMSAKMWVYK
jgi:multidrug resistance efflux pump